MKLKWHGHACFSIKSADRILLTDPFDESVGYKIPKLKPDIITESHQHFDHNAHKLIEGEYELITRPGEYKIHDFIINGYETFHDKESGALRGDNIIFDILSPEGFRIVHCGDLGHYPSPAIIEKLRGTGLLLLPVGGVYTISVREAVELVKEIAPSIVVPMHYKTPVLKFELETVNKFLGYFTNIKDASEIEIKYTEQLGRESPQVIVLEYK